MEKEQYLMLGSLLLMIVISLAIICFDDDLSNRHNCLEQKEFRTEEWEGVVTKKYIDRSNHSAETFEISGNKQKHVMDYDGTKFYVFVRIGDSLVKHLNTDTIKVYRQGQLFSFEIYFGCED